MSYQVEMRWDCTSCGSTGQLGRYKTCTNCGNPRDKAEMRMPLPGELERARRSSDYEITVTYQDRGKAGVTHTDPEGEAKYLQWLSARREGSDVYLRINNLGGVHSVDLQPR